MRRIGVIAMLVAFAAIAACSSSKGSDSAAQNLPKEASAPKQSATATAVIQDTCKLLTPEEASVEMGVKKVSVHRLKNAMGGITCDFVAPSDDELIIVDEPADFYQGTARTPGIVPVQGIGEKALWLSENGIISSHNLYILKDRNLADVTFPGKSPSLTPAMMKVGKEIASRM